MLTGYSRRFRIRNPPQPKELKIGPGYFCDLMNATARTGNVLARAFSTFASCKNNGKQQQAVKTTAKSPHSFICDVGNGSESSPRSAMTVKAVIARIHASL